MSATLIGYRSAKTRILKDCQSQSASAHHDAVIRCALHQHLQYVIVITIARVFSFDTEDIGAEGMKMRLYVHLGEEEEPWCEVLVDESSTVDDLHSAIEEKTQILCADQTLCGDSHELESGDGALLAEKYFIAHDARINLFVERGYELPRRVRVDGDEFFVRTDQTIGSLKRRIVQRFNLADGNESKVALMLGRSILSDGETAAEENVEDNSVLSYVLYK